MSRQVSNFVRRTEEAEGETVIVRPSATSLFAVDSDDRYVTYSQRRSNPTYPFKFSIQKNEALLNGFFKRMALTEFRMNWTLPNFSKAWGNTSFMFSWKTSAGGSYTTAQTDIPDGFYDINELASALQIAITTLSASLDGFSVSVSDQDYDSLIFTAPLGSTIYFYLSPVPTLTGRQLIDMINVPPSSYLTPTNVQILITGVPNLRPMDYMDIICSQLTYNQELKDASSAAITRDMMARIYLDDPVPSSAFSMITNLSGTSTSTLTPTAISGGGTSAGAYIFTTTTAAAATVKEGDIVFMSGLSETTPSGWNSRGTVIGVPKRTSPYQIQIEYDTFPEGALPTFGGTPLITIFSTISTWSIPKNAWSNHVNSVTPFVLYRQFPYPKQIRWNNRMPIGNVTFELYDDQGRSIQDLWNAAYPAGAIDGLGSNYANSFVWNASILVSED